MKVQSYESAEQRIATAPAHYAGMIDSPEPRFAVVRGARTIRELEAYLPSNYGLMESFEVEVNEGGRTALIAIIGGHDNAGWTLESYVIPRLASGLIGCEEIV